MRALRRDQCGQALVETALSMLVVAAVFAWTFELCMLVYTCAVLHGAAREGVRYATLHGSDRYTCDVSSASCGQSSDSEVVSVVQRYAALSLHNMSGMDVRILYPEVTGANAASLVSVELTYTYVPYLKLTGLDTTLHLSASGRIL